MDEPVRPMGGPAPPLPGCCSTCDARIKAAAEAELLPQVSVLTSSTTFDGVPNWLAVLKRIALLFCILFTIVINLLIIVEAVCLCG